MSTDEGPDPEAPEQQEAADGLEPLQAAARQLISAARAFLDAAEALVDDPEAVGQVVSVVSETARDAVRVAGPPAAGRPGPPPAGPRRPVPMTATATTDGDDGDDGPVQPIRVS